MVKIRKMHDRYQNITLILHQKSIGRIAGQMEISCPSLFHLMTDYIHYLQNIDLRFVFI